MKRKSDEEVCNPGSFIPAKAGCAFDLLCGAVVGMSHISLMLVDDDDTYRTVMAEELEHRGFDVHTFATGSAAVRAAATLAPQVVLLDLRLPDMNGIEVLRQIRATSPQSVVIMVTGQSSTESAVAARQAGAADYVGKPCPLAELEGRVARALERQRL